MKVAIIGYGKMGRQVERLALEKGWEIGLRVRDAEEAAHAAEVLGEMDVAIEFSRPEAAFENVRRCLAAGVPVVCGTTGWTERLPTVRELCRRHRGAFLYASNFSIGVNLFFAINRRLAALMDRQPAYQVAIEEVHHVHKRDHPSGTAITLAADIVGEVDRLEGWLPVLGDAQSGIGTEGPFFPVVSMREEEVPGTHRVAWSSRVDRIVLEHIAHNREGFAEGALLAARWLVGREGCFDMSDVLGLGTER